MFRGLTFQLIPEGIGIIRIFRSFQIVGRVVRCHGFDNMRKTLRIRADEVL